MIEVTLLLGYIGDVGQFGPHSKKLSIFLK